MTSTFLTLVPDKPSITTPLGTDPFSKGLMGTLRHPRMSRRVPLGVCQYWECTVEPSPKMNNFEHVPFHDWWGMIMAPETASSLMNVALDILGVVLKN